MVTLLNAFVVQLFYFNNVPIHEYLIVKSMAFTSHQFNYADLISTQYKIVNLHAFPNLLNMPHFD